MNKLKLIAGSSNKPLSEKIAKYLDVKLCSVTIDRFPDGEIEVKINENIRGVDVFIIQSTNPPAENLMELLVLIDTCFRASAERITSVIPYFGYARQDRKDRPRVPISAKLVANLLIVAGTSRVLTLDLHSAQIQGFFDCHADHLFAAPVMLEHIQKREIGNITIVSPDIGSIKMGRAFAKRLNADLAIVDKRRSTKDRTEVMNIIGEVKGKNIVLLDDMISTGSTLVEAAEEINKRGAKSILACATHPLFCGDACKNIMSSPIEEVVVTNSIPLSRDCVEQCPKVTVQDISHLMGEAIRRIHSNESVSTLFV
ncbi:MAG: ribose-phosphate diphosphokinase [Candidatus Latescibacteria bacterium]|nr:ribose-phosphate diphosphokinase [Candidatus Latescibacterota bacterium]NIM21123.1 ribose-phosphate diphosphokinase [Candidatus Latescibacterota bacterium]NIM65258.1 ribose-phosphate diphosphokinase [Candidatus Latescibacterota bacterium]NIO01773.1 ribose-phosphate diphosphokinase [Candidatus Latescibacterota bacterium]NIO28290.1 ribose-phosphate diphosphokinase [Candidatus Latescibacterota bacterium]